MFVLIYYLTCKFSKKSSHCQVFFEKIRVSNLSYRNPFFLTLAFYWRRADIYKMDTLVKSINLHHPNPFKQIPIHFSSVLTANDR